VLDELFKALLHKLITGEIRVGEPDLSALAPPGSGAGLRATPEGLHGSTIARTPSCAGNAGASGSDSTQVAGD
jgi:hypothetical protein